MLLFYLFHLFSFFISYWTVKSLFWNIRYLESKPQHWRPAHNVVVKDIEDVNKMKMALYVTHTINFQNYGDKNSRRSELVLELKKIFEEVKIGYHLLPQEVQVSYISVPPPARWSSLLTTLFPVHIQTQRDYLLSL